MMSSRSTKLKLKNKDWEKGIQRKEALRHFYVMKKKMYPQQNSLLILLQVGIEKMEVHIIRQWKRRPKFYKEFIVYQLKSQSAMQNGVSIYGGVGVNIQPSIICTVILKHCRQRYNPQLCSVILQCRMIHWSYSYRNMAP